MNTNDQHHRNTTQQLLASYIRQHANIDSIPAEDLAWLYVENVGGITGQTTYADVIEYAERMDANQYKYAESVEEFASELYEELTEWTDESEYVEELSEFVNWAEVWETKLKHDWTMVQVDRHLFGRKKFLFVMDF